MTAVGTHTRTLLPPDDPRHGTVNGYSNHKCRCELCRGAGTEAQRARRIRARARTCPDCGGPGGIYRGRCVGCYEVASGKRADRHHGQGARGVKGYLGGCRCATCTGHFRLSVDAAVRYLAGETHEQIAADYGVTRQRIEQRVSALDPDGRSSMALRDSVLGPMSGAIRAALLTAIGESEMAV